MTKHGIRPIDLAIINLYPFHETVSSGANVSTCIENIDIGGPAMIRAAAKNHRFVTIITNTELYEDLFSELNQYDGCVSETFRTQMAANAYAHTAAYDCEIANWFGDLQNVERPSELAFSAQHAATMRYGENPHQTGSLYRIGAPRAGICSAQQLQGKQLSYNNYNDTDAAFELVCEFDSHRLSAIAIIKHANPCGVCVGSSLKNSYMRALACDPISAFGGIIAANQEMDEECANEIIKIFAEVVIAPSYSKQALEIFKTKPNLRLLQTGKLADPHEGGRVIKSVAGGLLVQSRDNRCIDDLELKIVTRLAPTEEKMCDLKFAFQVAKHVKSNAIVYAHDGASVGIGAGQMSRVDSARIALRKANDAAQLAGLEYPLTKDCVMASDAFFPFTDGLLSAVEAGATAIIQPGGSMRDDEIIAAADEAGIAMVFTGMRHFRH